MEMSWVDSFVSQKDDPIHFVAKCELSKKVKFSDSCNNNKTVDESKCNVYGGNTGEVSSLTYKQVLVRDNVRKL